MMDYQRASSLPKGISCHQKCIIPLGLGFLYMPVRSPGHSSHIEKGTLGRWLSVTGVLLPSSANAWNVPGWLQRRGMVKNGWWAPAHLSQHRVISMWGILLHAWLLELCRRRGGECEAKKTFSRGSLRQSHFALLVELRGGWPHIGPWVLT